MKIFKLVGKESVLNLHLENPIHLDENTEYKLALTGFYSDNNIPNLRENAFVYLCYGANVDGKPTECIHTFTLEKGYWTIDKIQNKIRLFIQEMLNTLEIIALDPNSCVIDKHQDRVRIKSPVGFYFDPAISDLLGFDRGTTQFKPNVYHSGSKIPKLRTVDVIEIHCNLVEHSYVNHETQWHKHDETEILYHFFHNCPNQYKISEVPQEKFYVPLRRGTRKISEIKITIKDQDNQLLVNDGVNNIVYLSLIKQ